MRRLTPLLIRTYDQLGRAPAPNLGGDRDVEYSWVAANMAQGPGRAMDFGCGKSWMGLLAARKGYAMTAVDLTDVQWWYEHENLDFVRGDVAKLPLQQDSFDLIINCSSIEHVGLPGRYGVTEEQANGDLEAMATLRNLLKPGKEMVLTIPVGRDRVFLPRHRVYGPERLPRLLAGWEVVKKEFWGKDGSNQWKSMDEQSSLEHDPSDYYYGLGLFVLRKPTAETSMS